MSSIKSGGTAGASGGGASGGGTSTGGTSTDQQPLNEPAELNLKDIGEFPLETFINSLQLDIYRLLSEEAKNVYLEKFDALEMFNAIQEINSQLATVKLENHFLIDFLERNDPKMLIGLKAKRAATPTHARTTPTSVSTSGTVRRSVPSRHSEGVSNHTQSANLMSMSKKGQSSAFGAHTEYRLNFKTKCDMAEKATAEVEKRVNEIESKAMHTIKMVNARIEELRYRYEETEETIRNFQLHFLRDERDIRFLETANERQLERKFRKFVNNWLKNGRAMLSTMRLRVSALQERCQQLRGDLLTKAELSGVLGAVDFEQLMIKRDELVKMLEDKNIHMAGIKSVTGKASLAMAEEKQTMINIEEESKSVSQKTVEIIKNISKLEKEAKMVEEENKKEAKVLEDLKLQLERYQAPSVNQYIEKKDDLLVLEKEEKMLLRKVYITNMKLSNLLKRCNKKDDLPTLV